MSESDRTARQIAGRCRLARENAGLSQGQAAKKLGIARSSLTEAESNNRKISAAELTAMAGVYGVSVGWLACAADEEPDPDRDQVELAARELVRLKPEDLEMVMQLVKSIRSKDRGSA